MNPHIAGREYSVVADSNGLVRIKVDKPVRGVTVSESPILCSASLHYVRNGYASIRLTRQWELVDVVVIAVDNTTAFDFDTTFNTLDTEVKLEAYWAFGGGSPNLFWRVNGNAALANTASEWVEQGSTGGTAASGLQIAEADNAEAAEIRITADLHLSTGIPRMGNSYTAQSNGTIKHFAYALDNTTTEITSLGISSADIDSGSYFYLYRRPQFNKTKLKLWVY